MVKDDRPAAVPGRGACSATLARARITGPFASPGARTTHVRSAPCSPYVASAARRVSPAPGAVLRRPGPAAGGVRLPRGRCYQKDRVLPARYRWRDSRQPAAARSSAAADDTSIAKSPALRNPVYLRRGSREPRPVIHCGPHDVPACNPRHTPRRPPRERGVRTSCRPAAAPSLLLLLLLLLLPASGNRADRVELSRDGDRPPAQLDDAAHRLVLLVGERLHLQKLRFREEAGERIVERVPEPERDLPRRHQLLDAPQREPGRRR